MARPETILTTLHKNPRYLTVANIAQYGIAERIKGVPGTAEGTREASVSVTASYGGSDLTDLYTFRTVIEPLSAAQSRSRVDDAAAQKAVEDHRRQAEDLLSSFNNFLHSDRIAPPCMTLQYFIDSGLYEEFRSPDKDATAKVPEERKHR